MWLIGFRSAPQATDCMAKGAIMRVRKRQRKALLALRDSARQAGYAQRRSCGHGHAAQQESYFTACFNCSRMAGF
jgi:hypothetical protein